MAYTDEGGDGVGGWLSVFVVMVGIFSPLRMLISIVQIYNDPRIADIDPGLWTQIQLLEWGLVVLTLAACWYIVWRLFSRQYWLTVRITIALIWLISIGGLAIQLAGISLITGAPVTFLFQALEIRDFTPIILCTLWTAYFLTSKRVANTYPRHPEVEEAGQVFE
jgi:hypothetical protein